MKASLLKKEVGPYQMNTYLIIDDSTQTSAIVDPGGDPDVIMKLTRNTNVVKILITHGHFDHILALDDVKRATGAPVYIHPDDANKFSIDYEAPLTNGSKISVGNVKINILHVPGHTPGQCCFDLMDGRILVGDAIFVGGPGKTETPEEFNQTMETMKNIIFSWPDETRFFPGHGDGQITPTAMSPGRKLNSVKRWPDRILC